MSQFESIALAEKGRFHNHVIDLLRGLAALTVFVSHSDQGGLLKSQLISDNKIFLGRYGVYLFFILSGYLIWRSAQRTLPTLHGHREYAIHRVTRIVPLYLVNILFVVLFLEMIGSAFHPNVTQEILLRHLVFSQSLVPSVSRDLNPVLWTLTHEAIYYALVPCLFLLRARIWIIASLAAAFLLADKFGFRSFVSPFLTLFYLFVFGILVAERRVESVLIGTVSLLVVLRFSLEPDSVEFSASLSAAATFLLIWPAFALCAPSTWARWLTLPICWAGVVSYSLYIWHYLLVNIMSTEEHYRTMQSLFGVVWANDYGRAFVFTAFVMLVSAASYFLIEAPSMTSLRNWLIRLVSRPRQIKQEA